MRDVRDPAERERCADAYEAKIQWRPSEPYHLFALDIERASSVRSDGEAQRVMRWRAGGRLETSARRWAGSGYPD